MKKITFIFLYIFFISIQLVSQSKRVADRYFEEFAYVRAAKLYEAIYQKGDSSEYIITRLGDSYYNNAETEKAEVWYKKLITNFKNIDAEYLFKYAQVLRSNGDYKKSDSLFLVIANQDQKNNRNEELTKEDYLLDYSSNKNNRISIRNLALNTEYSDFGGFVINNEIYFASASPKGDKKEKLYKWNNQPFLNIYKADSYIIPLEESEKDSVIELDNKRILPPPINTQYHESTPVYTKDGKTMYFTRVNFDGKKLRKDKEATINLKLYKARFKSGIWGFVEELPFNSDEYSVGHPALSPDEKTLYFVSDMPGGIGGTDIYKVDIKENGYGEPVNLGETVNTSDKEMFPFIGHDNTLYFSSNGHLGLGLLDIFQTKIKEDNTYSEVLNLGIPFNSNKDDFAFFIDDFGKKGFLSSNRDNGKGDDDIYSYIIYEDPICLQSIAGTVRSTIDQTPIAMATVKLVNPTGEVVDEVLTKQDGTYAFNTIPCGEIRYTVQANKQDHRSDSKSIVTTNEHEKNFKVDLEIRPLIVGDQIVINPIYFDYDKSDIREDAEYELENIVIVMSNNPGMVIKIESHTDSRGGRDYNRNLSDRRAKSTRDYIISRGIAANRIESAIGYGEDQLLNDCNDANSKKCTEEEHQLNRRSYFYIVKGGENIDVINNKPSVIDEKPENNKQSQREETIKNKLKTKSSLIEKLNNFRKSRAKRVRDNKCRRDSDC